MSLKNGSFVFAGVYATGVEAKVYVPFVGRQQNCLKKCLVGKKQRTLCRLECLPIRQTGRLSGLFNISFFCPFTMFYF